MRGDRKRGHRGAGSRPLTRRADGEEDFCRGMVMALSTQHLKLLEQRGARLRAGRTEPDKTELEMVAVLREEWESTCELARRLVESGPEKADNHLSLGTCLQHLGRYEEAEASYREAIRLEPQDAGLKRLLELLAVEAARARRDDLPAAQSR